jgi:HK97 gp10 family phage protein
MDFTFELKGFSDIMQELENLCDSAEMNNINKKIVSDVSAKVAEEIKPKIPESKDLSKSGKTGNRPSKHTRDNIQITNFKKTKNGGYVTIKPSDDNWYFNFQEFGTSKMPPLHIFGDARDYAYKLLDAEGIIEYQKILQQKLDGGK